MLRLRAPRRFLATTSTVTEGCKNLRNVGIIAHIDAGKTTTTERMLRLSGAVSREGRVDNGNTVTDFLSQERERGITIQSAAVHFDWRDHTICLVDTPGHVDFTIEVERSLRVMDGAVLVVDAVAGVQAQTETVWRQAENYGLPAVAFVNKMDRDGADFQAACKSLDARLHCQPLPLQMPIMDQESETILGSLDLLTMKCYYWGQTFQGGGNNQCDEDQNSQRGVPLLEDSIADETFIAAAQAERLKLLEKLADLDDEFCELFLETMESGNSESESGDAIPLQALVDALRRITCASSEDRRVVPCVMGASLRGVGVEALLDSMVALLPSPDERSMPSISVTDTNSGERIKRKLKRSDDVTALCALAFKVANDRQRGALVYLRVYTGRIQKRQVLQVVQNNLASAASSSASTASFDPSIALNETNRASCSQGAVMKERITHLLRPFGDSLVPIDDAIEGNIVVAVGLKHTKTGDTLLLEKSSLAGSKKQGLTAASLEGIQIPAPVFALSVRPKDTGKAKALEAALETMARDDPSLVVGIDPDTDQLLVEGMGELHLDVACSRLATEFNVQVETGRVRIAYRETLLHSLTIEKFRYDRLNETETKRSFAGLSVEFQPRPLAVPGAHRMDAPSITLSPQAYKDLHGNVEWAAALEEGFAAACQRGPRHGFPLVGLDITVVACEADAPGNDTNAQVLRDAAEALLLHASKSTEVVLLEPMMNVEVTTPEEHLGSVLSDLTVSRTATIREVLTTGQGLAARHVVHCEVPLATLLGYSTDLRSITSGEGQFSMQYSHHAEIEALPDQSEKDCPSTSTRQVASATEFNES